MSERSTLTAQEIAFVQEQRVARLATANANGDPTLVPICYAFDGKYFYTPLDEKPKRVEGTQLRRVHNIQARPQVSLLIDRYDDDWSRLGYVLVHAYAELITPDHEQHAPALTLLRERYIQYRSMKLEHAPMIMLLPQRIVSWGTLLHEIRNSNSPFTQ